jgi:hypothetical protein
MTSLFLSKYENPPNKDILFIGFNQDNSCFVVCYKNSFIIYNNVPFKELFKRGKICLLLKILMEE